MSTARRIIQTAEAEICRPWLRHILPHDGWIALAHAAPAEGWILLAHWADTVQAHALFLDPEALTIVPVSTPVESGQYPALSPTLPAAACYQRMIRDLWGHEAAGAADLRPWLDHGNWPASPPMSPRPEPRPKGELPILDSPGDNDAMILPLGPIWGRIEEAAHLRLTLTARTALRAEALLGFTHKGTLTLMRGKSPRAAARFAARLSADATVAHGIAFAQATEAATDVEVPTRAAGLRIIMAEVERIAVHLDNLAEVARLAEASTLWTRCGYIREILLRASDVAFGHRLMMDCVIPGGVASDITEGGAQTLLRALGHVASAIPAIRRMHNTPSVSSRLAGIGRASGSLAASLGAGGVVARASGYGFDLRTLFARGYPDLAPRIAIGTEGDVAARQLLRILEIEEGLRLVGAALDLLPAGPISAAVPQLGGEGIGCAESSRGDVWHWLRLDHGQIAAAFMRDPGWSLWPLAERVLEHAAPEDIDLIRTSFGLPASGVDL